MSAKKSEYGSARIGIEQLAVQGGVRCGNLGMGGPGQLITRWDMHRKVMQQTRAVDPPVQRFTGRFPSEDPQNVGIPSPLKVAIRRGGISHEALRGWF